MGDPGRAAARLRLVVTRRRGPAPGHRLDHRPGASRGPHRGPVPDRLERLGQAAAAEPGPVAGGRDDEIGLQVVRLVLLGGERVDGRQFAADVGVDDAEVGRPELNRRGRRLEAVDPADRLARHHRGPVRVPVILVHVVTEYVYSTVGRTLVITSSITSMVGLPSPIGAPSRSPRNSRAPMIWAACSAARDRRTWSPAMPAVRVRMATESPPTCAPAACRPRRLPRRQDGRRSTISRSPARVSGAPLHQHPIWIMKMGGRSCVRSDFWLILISAVRSVGTFLTGRRMRNSGMEWKRRCKGWVAAHFL